MIRRIRSFAAAVADAIAGPLGWDVYVTVTVGRPGIDAWTLRRRPAGSTRPRPLAPWAPHP